ncbi:unnamed protein product, partial [Ixodes hexagonus]
MGQQARTILEKRARARIHQDHMERTSGTRSWAGWTTKSVPLTTPCETEFPPLGSPAASVQSLSLSLASSLLHLGAPLHLVRKLLIRRPPGQRYQNLQALLSQLPARPPSSDRPQANQWPHVKRLNGGTNGVSTLMS